MEHSECLFRGEVRSTERRKALEEDGEAADSLRGSTTLFRA